MKTISCAENLQAVSYFLLEWIPVQTFCGHQMGVYIPTVIIKELRPPMTSFVTSCTTLSLCFVAFVGEESARSDWLDGGSIEDGSG